MPKSAGASKPAKLSRDDKKLVRAAKRQQRKDTFGNIKQAFTLTRKNDPRFLPYLVAGIVLPVAIIFSICFVLGVLLPLAIVVAVLAGAVGSMLVFSRRAQRSMFAQAEGQAGAAGWLLQQQLRGDWRLTPAVAGTTQLDAVHRLVGRPGVVLVGEGAPHRVRGLLAQEKKRTARVVGETPIYDIVIGTEDGDVQLARLNRYLLKLPSNLSKEQVASLEKRLAALGGARAPLPQGPMPQGAKMRNVQRTVRRRS